MTNEESAFKIKTGNVSVLQLHLLTTDLALLQKELTIRLAQTPDFFASTPIVLELSGIAKAGTSLDFTALTAFMLRQGLCAAGVAGGSELQREDAVQSGLGLFSQARSASKTDAQQAQQLQLPEQFESPAFSAKVAERAYSLMPAAYKPTLVIDKPVRTGQRIYAEGASLVVLAIVNAGAELISDGDIHVYAPMRGKAIAGAKGNEAARIFVNSMEAELLSIAGCFKVFEEGIPENVRAKPVCIHLEGSRLVIEHLLY